MTRTITVRLDDRFHIGIALMTEKLRQEGYSRINKTQVVQMALEEFFMSKEITAEDIKAKLQEAQQPELIKTR